MDEGALHNFRSRVQMWRERGRGPWCRRGGGAALEGVGAIPHGGVSAGV